MAAVAQPNAEPGHRRHRRHRRRTHLHRRRRHHAARTLWPGATRRSKPDLRPLLRRVETARSPSSWRSTARRSAAASSWRWPAHYRVAVRRREARPARVHARHHSRRGRHAAAAASRRRREGARRWSSRPSPSRPADALASGLIDAIVDGRPACAAPSRSPTRVAARRRAAPEDERAAATGSARRRRTRRSSTPRARSPRKVRPHQPAPLKAIDAIEAATPTALRRGLPLARPRSFSKCVQHRTGQGAHPRVLRRTGRRQDARTCRRT